MAAVARGIFRCMSHSWRGILQYGVAVNSSTCCHSCSTGNATSARVTEATSTPGEGVVGIAVVVDAIHDACHCRRPQVLVLLLSPLIVPRWDGSALRVEQALFPLDCFHLLPKRHFDDAHASRPHVSVCVRASLVDKVGRRDGVVRRRCYRCPELFVGEVWQPEQYG
jgi:hypothetical protein